MWQSGNTKTALCPATGMVGPLVRRSGSRFCKPCTTARQPNEQKVPGGTHRYTRTYTRGPPWHVVCWVVILQQLSIWPNGGAEGTCRGWWVSFLFVLIDTLITAVSYGENITRRKYWVGFSAETTTGDGEKEYAMMEILTALVRDFPERAQCCQS